MDKGTNVNIELPESWQRECKIEPYMTYNEDNELTCLFMSSSFEKEESQYGPQNVFPVLNSEKELVKFATSSKRCMIALSEHFPLKDKRLLIKRLGSGMDTQYEVQHLEDAT